jgi:hypothetical protein
MHQPIVPFMNFTLPATGSGVQTIEVRALVCKVPNDADHTKRDIGGDSAIARNLVSRQQRRR